LIVTVTVPGLAVLLAVSVSVLVLVVLLGLNVAVTPFGKPEADRLTVPLKPFSWFTVMVLVTLCPRATFKLLGEADSLKSGAGEEALTVKLTEVVCVRLPEVPVMVTVTVPTAAVLLAVSVKVLLPVVGFGLKPADTPLGKTEVTDKPTLAENPFAGFTVIVVFPPAPPCAIAKLAGEADKLKSGAGTAAFTVRLTEVACVKLPDVPVMVSETVPIAAVPLAVSESVLLPMAGFGVNVAVTPLGNPAVTDNMTPPLKPFDGLMVMVLVPAAPPCTTVTLEGDAESEKSGNGAEPGQALSRLATLMVPMPVAKSQP